MLNRLSYILSVVALIGLASCSKVVDQVPIPNRGPADLHGQLLLLDEFQNDATAKPISGDSVHVTASKDGGEPIVATFDAAANTYTFPGLAPGTYKLTYSYDGPDYETIVNAAFEHFGGDTAVRVAKTFLYRRSTTVVDTAFGVQRDVVRNVPATRTVLLQPGDTLAVDSGSIVVIEPNSSVPIPLRTHSDTVFRPTVQTEYNVPTILSFVDRQLQFSVRLTQLSQDSAPRGYVAFFSTSPDVSNTNYIVQQDSILNVGVKNIDIPGALQPFLDRGFPAGTGTIYMAVYGLSGKKYWYGSRFDAANPGVKIYPGLNLNPAAMARGMVTY